MVIGCEVGQGRGFSARSAQKVLFGADYPGGREPAEWGKRNRGS